MDMTVLVEYLNSAIRVSVPVILIAVGVCYSERAGVFAMGSEGYMLIAAFVSVVTMIYTDNHVISVLAGILSGMAASGIFSYFTVVLGADQVICGLGSNFVMLGLTSSLQRLLWGVTGIPRIPAMNAIPIPILSDIPFIGSMLFNQPILTYVTYFLIPLVWWIMFKSTWGLQLRSVGENPSCADTLGINVVKTRILGIVTGGAFCGLSGAVLSLSQVQSFTENISGGRGWLGLIGYIWRMESCRCSGGRSDLWCSGISAASSSDYEQDPHFILCDSDDSVSCGSFVYSLHRKIKKTSGCYG